MHESDFDVESNVFTEAEAIAKAITRLTECGFGQDEEIRQAITMALVATGNEGIIVTIKQ